MTEVINFGAERMKRKKHVKLAYSKPVTALIKDEGPTKPLEEIVAETIASMLIELEKEGIESENAKIIMRIRIIERILSETLHEIHNKGRMTDWMKRLLLHF